MALADVNGIGFYLKVFLRYHVTCVRDPTIRLIPGSQFPADAFIPYSEWSTLEGYGENPDEDGDPSKVVDFAPSGTAADLTFTGATTEWVDDV